MEKEAWCFQIWRPHGEQRHWSLFLGDHRAAFHSFSTESPVWLCSAAQSLNKSPNAFYLTNTKMSFGVMTLTASECHDCHLFVLCIEQRFASQKTQVQWLWKIACVLFAIPMVKGHPFYWDSNLRDQKKEQCDSIMGRSQILSPLNVFVLRCFHWSQLKWAKFWTDKKWPHKLLYCRLGLQQVVIFRGDWIIKVQTSSDLLHCYIHSWNGYLEVGLGKAVNREMLWGYVLSSLPLCSLSLPLLLPFPLSFSFSLFSLLSAARWTALSFMHFAHGVCQPEPM